MNHLYFPQYARGRKGAELVVGETLLDHIRRIGGIGIASDCGGRGTCGKDLVRIDEGSNHLAGPTEVEKHLREQGRLSGRQRLACQARVADDNGDIIAYIPDFGTYTVLTETVDTGVEYEPSAFRRENRVVYRTGEDLGPYTGRIFGLAVDIGTTTIAMQVVDLESGANVGRPLAAKNPQIAYGNDVISRIGYTMKHSDGLAELQQVVVDGVNGMLADLDERLLPAEDIPSRIYDVTIVGNSTMRDLFFGIPVRTLGSIPFEPLSTEEKLVSAADLGLNVHPQARVYGAPLIGGQAGADCLADIISTRLYERRDIGMIIDIGTNGEVVIGNRDRIMSASCAAGGAYEGYQISCGVGAVEGAITDVRIFDGRVEFSTIAHKPPVGVCGSGVIDLLAELRRNGLMNERTRIDRNFHIVDGISITQEDVNQLVIAKAGLRTDQDLLTEYYGTTFDEVHQFYLAGGFGNFIRIESAVAIGLLPRSDTSRFVKFGNGALAGARDMLVSQRRRDDATRVVKMVEHTKPNEIEGESFQYRVAENMYIRMKYGRFGDPGARVSAVSLGGGPTFGDGIKDQDPA